MNLQQSQIQDKLRSIGSHAQLLSAVRRYLREPLTPEHAREEVKRLLTARSATFISLLSRIYSQPSSPYLRLLRIAGCELSDIEQHVKSHGVEAALERLAGEGVYLTSDEFRGKKEVVRGSASFRVSSIDFTPSGMSGGFITQTSGSSRAPLPVVNPVEGIETAVKLSFFAAHDLLSSAYAVYDATLPASGGVREMLATAKMRIPMERWFARKIPNKSPLHAAYNYLNTRLLVLAAKSVVPGVPFPESVDSQKPEGIVRWLLARRREGKKCCIKTAASNAVRIARLASELGVSLEGTTLICSGEPLTEAKQQAIERTGARTIPRCGFEEGDIIGFGCADPTHPDDMHVVETQLVLISHPIPISVNDFSIRPLLFTGLHRHPRKILLNVQNGDFGTLERRDCGCLLGKLGLTLHLRDMRSFEKFTTEGMNYLYVDLYELLETILPTEFGGGPGDYQLAEEEDGNGQTRLTLRVHPRLGNLDEDRLLSRLREVMAQGPGGNRFTTEVWRGAGVFKVTREPPRATLRGKILPLHVSRSDR